MSDFFYPSTRPKATKDYHCQACEHISCAWNEADILALPDNERKAYELAKSKNFRILKGEEYVCQSGVYDGQFYTFRRIPDMVDICHKYELFPDD